MRNDQRDKEQARETPPQPARGNSVTGQTEQAGKHFIGLFVVPWNNTDNERYPFL
jgi:hypothetical protein